MAEQLRRLRILARVVQVVSLVVGVLAAAGGIVYLTVTASDLPSWYPGTVSITTSAHHVARGWVLLAVAVIAFVLVAVAGWAMAGVKASADAGTPELDPAPEAG